MIAPAFHALAGNAPRRRLKVYLLPLCADHLARAGSGQNQELKRRGARSRRVANCFHEGRDLAEWHRLEMLRRVLCTEYVLQVTLPTRRVVAFAELVDGCPVKNPLNA